MGPSILRQAGEGVRVRCEICGEGSAVAGLPDIWCWDGVPKPGEIEKWAERIRRDPSDLATRLLALIDAPESADALRALLDDREPRLVSAAIQSLAHLGSRLDGARLLVLLDHADDGVRLAAADALAELDVTAAIGPLTALRAREVEPAVDALLLECLAWLRAPAATIELRNLLESRGPDTLVGRSQLARLLARAGDPEDRKRMAAIAVAALEQSAADGFVASPYVRRRAWDAYAAAVAAVAPHELAVTESRLSEAAQRALTPYWPAVPARHGGTPDPGARSVPRRSIVGFSGQAPPGTDEPPAKFFGLPDWREEPAWPIGGDGCPLLFWGQLPLEGGRTAYLFTGGPEEWEPLGPGSALVIQPGGSCHLPTESRHHGPRAFDDVRDPGSFRPRRRRAPRPERFVVWSDGLDPASFSTGYDATKAEWNKVGGTPIWLQGDTTPGPEWSFAFQFDADWSGADRGDGAVFYGWTSTAGGGALGWDCH